MHCAYVKTTHKQSLNAHHLRFGAETLEIRMYTCFAENVMYSRFFTTPPTVWGITQK